MAAELFFIYDTHCPWSYVTTRLVNQIHQAHPEINIQLFHCGRYQGDDGINPRQLGEVSKQSDIKFNDKYRDALSQPLDSTMAANLMAWVENKANHTALPVLNALQKAHFEDGVSFDNAQDFDQIVGQFKLSPPSKVFNRDKYSKDAENALADIEELQGFINTSAIPALLLAVDEELILLNHNFYLSQPSAIVEAVELELKNH